jgi:hypothetical protein
MHHSAPTSRRLTWAVLVSALLAAGAIVNIAVAWACILWQTRYGEVQGVLHWGDMGRTIERHELGDIARAIKPAWPSEVLDDRSANMWVYEERARGVIVAAVHCFSQELATVCCAGWPMISLDCCWVAQDDSLRWGVHLDELPEWTRRAGTPYWASVLPHVALPLRPDPLGFATNTILYAALLAPLGFACRGAWRRVRGTLRFRHGHCPKCGYDMSGLPKGVVCPECGGTKQAPGEVARHGPASR